MKESKTDAVTRIEYLSELELLSASSHGTRAITRAPKEIRGVLVGG